MKLNNGITFSLRILHVQASVAPNFGGPTTVLSGLTAAQAKKGHRVTVCTTNRDHPAVHRLASTVAKSLFSRNVEVLVFPVLLVSVLYSPAMAGWLRKHIREYDIVHIHGLYRFPLSYAAIQARKQGVPYIVRPCGTLDPYLHDKSARSLWLKRLYERFFSLPSLKNANAIHYTAQEERRRVAHLGLGTPSFVIPNGLDWSRFERLPIRGRFRNRYRLGDAPLVLYLGRLHFKKGLDLLIPAFDKVLRGIPGARLAIVGAENDDYGARVREWVKEYSLEENVHFTGPLEGQDVLQAYVDSDVFVLPSYTENFGMTVIEAMACGLPVVISDQVNIHSDVQSVGAGFVTGCEVSEVADRVSSVLNCATQRQSMGQAGREATKERYAWSVIVDSLSEQYVSLIEKAREPLINSNNLR